MVLYRVSQCLSVGLRVSPVLAYCPSDFYSIWFPARYFVISLFRHVSQMGEKMEQSEKQAEEGLVDEAQDLLAEVR